MVSDKEVVPQVLEHPGTRPTEKGHGTVDERILAHRAHPSPTSQEHKYTEKRTCFYCLEGWVFLGSLDHDGEEIAEAIRCRRCDGMGRIKST